MGQASYIKWCQLRRYRLTSSHFHLVLSCIRRKKYVSPSLFKTLQGSYNLDGVKAVQWGKHHEHIAIQELEKKFLTLVVKPTGLWLDETGILGSSLDGLILDSNGNVEFVVEVKRPYKYKDKDLYTALRGAQDYFVFIHDDGDIVYNPNHGQV